MLFIFSLDTPASGFLVADERWRGETKKIQKGQKRKARGQVSSIQIDLRGFYIPSLKQFWPLLFSGSAKESKSSKGTPKTPKTPKSSEKKEEVKETVKEKKVKESSKNK